MWNRTTQPAPMGGGPASTPRGINVSNSNSNLAPGLSKASNLSSTPLGQPTLRPSGGSSASLTPSKANAASNAANASISSSQSSAPPRPALLLTLRLIVHPKSFSSEELIWNPKSVPGFKVGDIVEIFQLDNQQQGSNASNNSSVQARGGNPTATSLMNKSSNSNSSSGSSKDASSGSSAITNPLDANNSLFIKIQSLEPVKANFDLSISSALADLFHLQGRKDVYVRLVTDVSRISLDFIEISFKNQYIGRSDNWRIKNQLQAMTVFNGQPMQVEGMKMRIDEILLSGRPAKSGLITSATRFTFRSRSARLFFLIQLSEEQWDFADDGELYFEKVLGFLKILFTEWQKLKVTHALSIIFFSRTFLEMDEEWEERQRNKLKKKQAGGGAGKRALNTDSNSDDDEDDDLDDDDDDDDDDSSSSDSEHSEDGADGDEYVFRGHSQSNQGTASSPQSSPSSAYSNSRSSPPMQTDPHTGRFYQDHYQVVVDCEVHDFKNWDDLIKLLKKKFNKYHLQLKWGTTDKRTGLRGFPSTAAEGNFLEAINCAVSVYDKHYLDRDLYKTGQNIVLFSAGIGMFVVDPKLARLTKQRMVDGGIGCDLICMTRPPLHSVPLFSFKDAAVTSGPHSQIGFTHINPGTSSSKEPRFNRAQSSPAFVHHNAARRGSSHLISTFNSLQNSIQEGTEENEEKTNESHSTLTSPKHAGFHASNAATPTAAGMTVPSGATFALPPEVMQTPERSKDLAPPMHSPLSLPPPSELAASRISPSPTPTPLPPTGASASPPVVNIGAPVIGHSAFSPGHDSGPLTRMGSERSLNTSRDRIRERSDNEEHKTDASGQALSQYYVPHWLSIYFYDYQDLYDTPFGSLKTSHRDDVSRNRNEEFVSLSSCKLFDFFDLSFFNTRRKCENQMCLVPYFTNKEIAPPSKPNLFDAYDSSVFNPPTAPIGVLAEQQQKQLRLSQPPALQPASSSPPMSTANLNRGESIGTAVGIVLSAEKKLAERKPAGPPRDAPPHSTTSGPNVALQQHTSGAKSNTTVFQSRWGHLFGHLYATLDHLHNPLRPNWKSLCQPAILPLTTDYFPTLQELRVNYFEYNHTLVLVQNQNDYNNNARALLDEVICQRQAQDYQHILSEDVPRAKDANVIQVFFSLRNQVHQISMDKRTNEIDVRRYVSKRVIQDLKLVKFPYQYFLWSSHTNSFLKVQRDIEPNRDELKWSDADNLLCDRYSADLTEEMKYRRNHYAIIPLGIPPGKFISNEALQSTSKRFASYAEGMHKTYEEEWAKESEKRIAAFKAFFTFMLAEKGDKIVAAATPSSSSSSSATSGPGSSSSSSAAASAAAAAAAAAANPALAAKEKEKAEKLAQAQQQLNLAFQQFGVEIDTKNDKLPFPLPPVKTEEERKKDEEDIRPYLDEYENSLGFAIAQVRTGEIKIPLTNKLSGVSDELKRYEWFQLQYDSVFNPHAVYHMEIKWLVATGMHLESWIKNFCKKAETRFGLQIVKIPTNQPLRSSDSFHVPVPMPIHNPYILRLVEEYLIRECGFVMDSELEGGCRQYVHESGMCAVRRLPHGFIWVNNHLPSASQHRKASVHLFGKIKKYTSHLIHCRNLAKQLVADVLAFQDMKSGLF